MNQILIVQYRRGVAIAIWRVPADTFAGAVFQLRMGDWHRAGDHYVQCDTKERM